MRLPVSHWADDTLIHLGILIRGRLYSLRGGPQCLFLLISGSDVWASLVFFILIFVGRPFLILGGMFRSSVAVWDIVPPFLHLNQLVLFLSLELPNSTLPSVAIINIFMSHPASYNHDFIKSVVSLFYIYEGLFYQAFVTCIPWTAFFLASNIGILRNSYMRKWYLCHLCGGRSSLSVSLLHHRYLIGDGVMTN